MIYKTIASINNAPRSNRASRARVRDARDIYDYQLDTVTGSPSNNHSSCSSACAFFEICLSLSLSFSRSLLLLCHPSGYQTRQSHEKVEARIERAISLVPLYYCTIVSSAQPADTIDMRHTIPRANVRGLRILFSQHRIRQPAKLILSMLMTRHDAR